MTYEITGLLNLARMNTVESSNCFVVKLQFRKVVHVELLKGSKNNFSLSMFRKLKKMRLSSALTLKAMFVLLILVKRNETEGSQCVGKYLWQRSYTGPEG